LKCVLRRAGHFRKWEVVAIPSKVRERMLTGRKRLVPVPAEDTGVSGRGRRQARERGIVLRMELLLYTIHGMLHLCGFGATDQAR